MGVEEIYCRTIIIAMRGVFSGELICYILYIYTQR